MSEPEKDPVALLMRLAGPRTVVPEERTERVRAAAREAWRSSVRRHARVRTLIGLAIAAGIAALAITIPRLAPLPENLPTRAVVATSGGSPVLAGTSFDTDPDHVVVLRLTGGASVSLAAGTRVHFETGRRIRLDRGTVSVETGPPGAPLQIATRWGVVRDVGTEFEVRVTEEELRVRVKSGLVILATEHAGEERVEAGTEMRVSASGHERTEISPKRSAPAFDIEGRSLREFLAWAALEKRLGLRFTPDSLEAKASRTVLHGSIAKMTADEALRAVLPTTDLTAAKEGAELVVRSRR